MTSPILQSTTGEAYPQRSGVTNTMRSRIVRIGAKHLSQEELNRN